MAATTLVSVEEYLRTTTSPDCEYVHGVLKERAVPEWDHAAWQKALMLWFASHERDWGILVFAELRIQVAADHYRIPDIVLLSRNAPREQIVSHPPLAVFEILSPGDAMPEMLDKFEAYEQMGIPAIWVVNPRRDPRKPAFLRYSSGQLTPTAVFELPGTDFSVPMSEIAATVE